EDKRDYQVVEIDFPHMFAAVTSGRVDLASISLPFSIAAEDSGKVRTLFTMKDAIGESDMTVMAARASFIAAHRAAFVDFFADAQRAMQWFLDPANRGAVVGIIAAATRKPDSFYSSWLFTKRDDYRDPLLKPNLEAVQRDVDRQVKLGFLKARIDVQKYADLSLLREAATRQK
ncbi:MAG: ABC transporter substrate-binding protein, partial [Stellaceae bacterium]